MKRKLIAVSLIAVLICAGLGNSVACGPTPTPTTEYELTIASTAGGSVTIPGEGTFTYSPGTVVGLVAEVEGGYCLVEWTGDVGTVANVEAATTTVIMGGNYSITANFVEMFAGGNGAEENPYQIANWHHLYNVRVYLDDYFILMNDLDSTTTGYGDLASPTANQGQGWQPIGTEDSPFTGTFDGQGYEIRDLFINRPDETNVGLFGKTYEGGVIEDIGVVNVTVIAGDQHVGGLVGWNEGTNVSNSYSTGSVTGPDDVGGLVGWNYDSTVSNSYSTCNVTGDSDVGGLVGDNWGTVSNSYASGKVTGGGGLVGAGGGAVSNSFWDIETSGQATSDGGTGKNTTEMQDIDTFTDTETEGLDEPWDIIAVANPGIRNLSYIWNIVDDETYPFLSWES